ncbi:hypothetical protein FC14_GL000289 [Ligilactobacillus agilis DSM 20509]|uniref:HTH LytTR-type domain-containing protein n=1 Tax=Ligilactobacillus agilis DSM 20509 TaxID=1423718 RepID=A0A0R2AA69_9LACO|nr:LytTR family DNA-binding domain-containing protein [Ligilactobacillus agilis]KRM63727.1 hypothetical protein FC14_GL000289 [Ligilactobacillus agilis DSM 20509]MCI5762611.1 LytTR family transcriptional regulator [Ligilactobacillus agilis]MCL8205105.1 LytTR family transcriptional regulator [Ligilactobacillus agilis]
MKVTLKYDKRLARDEIGLTAREKNMAVNRIADFAIKEVFRLVAQKDGEQVLVELADVQQIYATNKKVYCFANKQEYLLKERLYQLLERLPNSFVQISRSEIIQLRYVERFIFTRNGIIEIIFKDGQKTSVSRRYFQKIKGALYHA